MSRYSGSVTAKMSAMSRVSRSPTLTPTALAMTRRDRRAVDFTAISAAIQAPNDTPTTVTLGKIKLVEQIEIEI